MPPPLYAVHFIVHSSSDSFRPTNSNSKVLGNHFDRCQPYGTFCIRPKACRPAGRRYRGPSLKTLCPGLLVEILIQVCIHYARSKSKRISCISCQAIRCLSIMQSCVAGFISSMFKTYTALGPRRTVLNWGVQTRHFLPLHLQSPTLVNSLSSPFLVFFFFYHHLPSSSPFDLLGLALVTHLRCSHVERSLNLCLRICRVVAHSHPLLPSARRDYHGTRPFSCPLQDLFFFLWLSSFSLSLPISLTSSPSPLDNTTSLACSSLESSRLCSSLSSHLTSRSIDSNLISIYVCLEVQNPMKDYPRLLTIVKLVFYLCSSVLTRARSFSITGDESRGKGWLRARDVVLQRNNCYAKMLLLLRPAS